MSVYIRPAGPADAEAILSVQSESWRSAYARLLPPETLEKVDRMWDLAAWIRTLERIDQRLVVLVAESATGGVLGYGMAGARRAGRLSPLQGYGGEIQQLYLRPAAQGKGMGAALLSALARVLLARGLDSALVWALAGNDRAEGFYQHLGARRLLEADKPFLGGKVREVAFGWSDLGPLAGAMPRIRD